jgi:hypothetical protein
VDHKPWVLRNTPIPPGIYDEVCRVIRRKLAAGVYEPSNSSYRSRWFCVVKKDGTSLRLIHSLEPLNAVTIQHSGVPPFTDLLYLLNNLPVVFAVQHWIYTSDTMSALSPNLRAILPPFSRLLARFVSLHFPWVGLTQCPFFTKMLLIFFSLRSPMSQFPSSTMFPSRDPTPTIANLTAHLKRLQKIQVYTDSFGNTSRTSTT